MLLQKSKAYALLIGSLLLFANLSCETDSPDDLVPVEVVEDDPDGSPALVTYENGAKNILDNACVECHGGATPTAGIRLDNFVDASAVADSGRMLARMTSSSNPMPPSGNLPDVNIQVIMDWINDGLLEN